MSFADPMLRTHPNPAITDDAVAACIRACFDCAQACSACADACLGEADPKALARCIRPQRSGRETALTDHLSGDSLHYSSQGTRVGDEREVAMRMAVNESRT